MLKRSLSLQLTIVATFACDPGPAAHYQAESLPGGGRRVTNTGASSWTTESEWQLEENLTLGTPDGEGPDVFGFIAAFRVSTDGMIYVLESMSQEVRAFDPSGEFSHTIGRQGSGPGEFSMAADFHLAPDGRVLVPDLRAARYSVFDRDGAFVTSYPRRVRGSAPFGGFTPNGRYVDWGTSFPEEGPEVVAGPRIMFEPRLLTADFSDADSLPPLEFVTEMTADGRRPQIFFAGRLTGYQDQTAQIWFAHSREYQIFRRAITGDTTLVFSLPAVPAEVTEEDRETVRERFNSRPEMAARYLENMSRTKPVVRRVFGDNAGHVYVVPELAGIRAGTVLDVFRDTGRYLGRMDLPVAMHMPSSGPLASATRDYLYYVVADELDVPRLSRFRIIRPFL